MQEKARKVKDYQKKSGQDPVKESLQWTQV